LESPFNATDLVDYPELRVVSDRAGGSADARGGGGYNRGNVGDEHLAGGRRHGNNAYMKAASEERDKLLNTQLKSICRGC
jgi:hypothetical protein